MPLPSGRTKRKKNRIITLLTDFGLNDPFVGVMKGVILKINPDAEIIDLTHNVPSYDIFAGAFALFESYKYFPSGTIHVAIVDPGVGGKRKNIIITTKDYTFITPDNGITSLALKNEKILHIYEITNPKYILRNKSNTFHGRDVFAPAAAYLSKGVNPGLIGKELNDYNNIEFPEIHRKGDSLIAELIYIDKFGNCVTNIPHTLAEEIKNIRFKKLTIDRISKSYEEGRSSEAIAVIGSAGFLEIAVNRKSAAAAFGIKLGNKITVGMK